MGIIENMSNEEYHSQNGISSTAVKSVFKKSLAHWKGEKRRQTAAFSMGSAVHALLLEKDRDLVVKGPKTRKSKGFTELEENAGPDQIVLTEVEYHVAHRMATETLKNPVCEKSLRHKDRQNEVSIFAECERTGLVLKTRPDLYIPSEGLCMMLRLLKTLVPLDLLKSAGSTPTTYKQHSTSIPVEWRVFLWTNLSSLPWKKRLPMPAICIS